MNLTLLRASAKALNFPEQKLRVVSPNDEGDLAAADGTPYEVTINMTAKPFHNCLQPGSFCMASRRYRPA